MACSNPQSMGHAHCTLCGNCLVCDPHPPHTPPMPAPKGKRK
jgi:hypothetical protein